MCPRQDDLFKKIAINAYQINTAAWQRQHGSLEKVHTQKKRIKNDGISLILF